MAEIKIVTTGSPFWALGGVKCITTNQRLMGDLHPQSKIIALVLTPGLICSLLS